MLINYLEFMSKFKGEIYILLRDVFVSCLDCIELFV